ncbi:AAA-type ATPase family protein / ankyrin repeat family protein isoform 2 [Hibiscus syriacus]|uniref:AAA-type ATPase family protein / ankyrin repeat family protein isoform 2 n=1 Tax=Hibiscus syriacus TaxID=106335 RepID=A0A6A2YEM0_HIBSY|nr:AAA-type ATPase family protein / ankyrin repeat family protein isoform 2 [Hibiscus syriacus]
MKEFEWLIVDSFKIGGHLVDGGNWEAPPPTVEEERNYLYFFWKGCKGVRITVKICQAHHGSWVGSVWGSCWSPKALHDKPFLLNERNPVIRGIYLARNGLLKLFHGNQLMGNYIAQTPLHVAAGNDRDQIVNFCSTGKGLRKLNWKPNMYGETPLHMAAKNGCNEAVRLLLAHAKRRALEACSEAKAKMDELEKELSNIVGLQELKVQLRKWAKGMLLDERRRALGLKVGIRRPPHMAFLGNPGTGKTMVARVLGKLLHMVGILPTDMVTEVQRTDLVGEFVGHTGPKTRRKIQEAEGGILFVDEAYRLIPMQKSDDKDYGLEALEEIMSVMDTGKIVVIFAGYSEPMKRVIASNEGFCRRVTKFFHFSDFNSSDLANILHIKMNNQTEQSLLYGFKLDSSCSLDAIARLIERETTEKQRKEMNGGLVDPMLVNARENIDLRLSFDCIDADELCTITLEDLEAGIQLLSH